MELKIERLSKTYANGVHALREVSLAIPPGMFGLLGPNGAGKSTLMRILATLQEADAGRVTFGEIDVLREKDALRRTLGYLPQEFGLYPKVEAEELLDHFAVLKGIGDRKERKAVVRGLLQQTNLWDARNKRLGGFSGGMRQRFGIAVALLGNPRLIIVDEPTAGLDPAERVRFLNLLSELGENAVVLLSTHIVEDVSELCSRMAIINHGQILLEAEPLAAIAALRGRVWRRVVARESLAAFEAAHPVISTKLLSGRTVIHVVDDRQPDESFQAVEPDLEDVYFSVMRGIPLHRAPAARIEVALPAEPAAAGAPIDEAVAEPSAPVEVAVPDQPADAPAKDPVGPDVEPVSSPQPVAREADEPVSPAAEVESDPVDEIVGSAQAGEDPAIPDELIAPERAAPAMTDSEPAAPRRRRSPKALASPASVEASSESIPDEAASDVSSEAVTASDAVTSPEDVANGQAISPAVDAELDAASEAIRERDSEGTSDGPLVDALCEDVVEAAEPVEAVEPQVAEGATLPLFGPDEVPGVIAEPEPPASPAVSDGDGDGGSGIVDLPDQLGLFGEPPRPADGGAGAA